jgi:hypothetical protein
MVAMVIEAQASHDRIECKGDGNVERIEVRSEFVKFPHYPLTT